MTKPLHVAFVWHMHQPYYKDDLTNTYLLPWVRLRSAKDYFKMPALLDAYPKVRATFNLVPSLLAQIEDYGKEDSVDLFLNLSKRNADELSSEERTFLIRWMRESPRALRVQQSPRYLELASRAADAQFTNQDMLDLQIWFNLAWCDPAWAESDPRLAELKRKDRDFSESDKEPLFEAQMEIMQKIMPKYREMTERVQVELTFSPYYPPILPLLIHIDSARTANPQIQLPEHHFSHREDAERQVEMGQGLFERLLQRRPTGMWPSEMAVGESVVGLATKAGVDWMVSDEEVLARSLDTHFYRDNEGRVNAPDQLYRPFEVEREGQSMAMVFRDSQISNSIGFDYQRMSSVDAAHNLVGRLRRIREQQGDKDYLAVIALDGENAWEFYPRDGHDFLNALYTELEATPDIVTTTVSDFLREHPAQQNLHHLHTGSWIGASLDTWIGDPEHNVAWELLADTRTWLDEQSRQRPQLSDAAALGWREILITEGSDWFWWFSRKHDSGMDTIWDNQFRLHLRNVYKLMGVRAPARLFRPIIQRTPTPERKPPAESISPKSRSDSVWGKAGFYVVGSGFGALHRPAGVVERVLYGCDTDHVYVRLDSPRSPEELEAQKIEFWLYFSGVPADKPGGKLQLPLAITAAADFGFDAAHAVRILPNSRGAKLTVARVDAEQARAEPVAELESSDPFFISIPLETLGRHAGETMEMAVVVSREGRDIEQVPPSGSLGLRIPGDGAAATAPDSKLLKMLPALKFSPDVIHLHDWFAALVPNLIDRVYTEGPAAEVATALTIHNLAAQGVFGFGALTLASLDKWGLIRVGIPGLDNVVNLLGRGIHYADVVNTVSERYAAEMQMSEYGEGLDELIRSHAHKLHGIVNGIDYEIFDPHKDSNIPHHYSASAPEPKALCRAELRSELGLEQTDRPLCAMVSTLYDVKGLDLVEQAMPALMKFGVQVVVIGTGDRRYEDMFRRYAGERSGQVAAAIGFDAPLAQRIYAGADMLWMPSRYEPGGLAQLIALRYGTVPVVRVTGGLADTIKDYDPVASKGNGFTFAPYDPWQFYAAVVRAAETYRHPSLWSWLIRRDMNEDVSWSKSAQRYVHLFHSAIASRRERRGVATVAD